MQLEGFDPLLSVDRDALYGTDIWILSRLDETIDKMSKNFEMYEI